MQTIESKMQEVYGFYDFEKGMNMLSFDSSYERILAYLTHTNLQYSKAILPYNPNNLKSDTMAFYGSFFSLCNVLVLPAENELPFSFATRENDDNKIQNLLEGIKEYCALVSPFDIPVTTKTASPFYGELTKRLFPYKDEPGASEIPIIYTGISLGYPYSRISPPVYSHEVTHTQVFSNKNSLESANYIEALSIFVEKLCAFNQSLSAFREMEKRRCYALFTSLNKLKNGNASLSDYIYISSTLIAEKMFNNYVYSSPNDKAEIISSIQNVFDGKLTVGQILTKLGVIPDAYQNEYSIASNLRI